MGDRWGYGREVLKRNGKFRMREEEVRLVKNTESFCNTGLFRLVAELIFLRRYGLQHKYASENGFLVATASG